MFFVASKIFWLLASPVILLLIVALTALVISFLRSSLVWRVVALGAILLLAALAATPIGLLLIAPLEDRFPEPPPNMPPPDGIIVLGGAIRSAESTARGQTVFSDGERVVEAAILAKRYPDARVIFSGGNGSLLAASSTEAQEARKLFVELGVDPSRITLEDASRNTDENARFTAKLVGPVPGQRFLLVTSAYHMPRSMGLFEKAGFNVTAFPVAFRALGEGRGLLWDTHAPRNLETFDIAAKEWIGLVAYRATGRIDSLFPGRARRVGRAGSARPAERPTMPDGLFGGGRAETIDAAKIRWIDDLAFPIDHEPAFQSHPDGGAADRAQMRAPAEFAFAARLGERLGGIDRADGAALRRPSTQAGDDRLDDGVRFGRHGSVSLRRAAPSSQRQGHKSCVARFAAMSIGRHFVSTISRVLLITTKRSSRSTWASRQVCFFPSDNLLIRPL